MGDQTFARLIRKRRDALGLSQARLGELVGRSATTIRNWERAQASPSERSDVVALAAVLGLNEGEVLEQAGFEPPVVEDKPTMEQAYASLTSETVRVMAAPSVEGTPADEAQAAPEPEIDVDSTPPPDVRSAAIEAEPDVEEIEAPVFQMPPAFEETVSALPDFPIGAESGRLEGDPTEVQADRGRTRRAAPPTVLEAATPGEPSYIEDADERERYRVRAVATALLVVAILIVLLWSFDRATDALGGLWDDLIDSLAL